MFNLLKFIKRMSTINKTNLPEYWLVKSGDDVTTAEWQSFIDTLNELSAISESIKGELTHSYYGMMMEDIPVILDTCPEEFTLYTLEEFNTVIEGTIEYVETYNGVKSTASRTATIGYGEHTGKLALKPQLVNEVYLPDDIIVTNVLRDECTRVLGLGFVITSLLDNNEYDDIAYSDYNEEYIYTEGDDVWYGIIDSYGNEGYFINKNGMINADDDTVFASSDIAQARDYIYSSRQDKWVHMDYYDDWDEERLQDQNAGYHTLSRKDKRNGKGFSIGFEVEKEDVEACKIHYSSLHNDTGWCKESDSSLDSYGGYELVSPIYSLIDKKQTLENDLTDSRLKDLINADFDTSTCGGHINVGHDNIDNEHLFEGFSGFFPLFYAMYEYRLDKTYSQAKKKHDYYRKDKYSSIYMKGNVVEFRIPGAYRNVGNLLWRRDLIAIMAKNFNKSELDVLKMMLTPKSELFKHLRKVYTAEQMIAKAEAFIRYAAVYNNKVLPKIDTKVKNKIKAVDSNDSPNQQV